MDLLSVSFTRDLTPHKSTGDLFPRCRSQALRERRLAARSKINFIARRLYDLKYDHEWQQKQLEMLRDRGETIEQGVDAAIQHVKEAEEVVAGMEELKLGTLGKDGELGSQRSTEPEVADERRDSESAQQKKEKDACYETGIKIGNAEKILVPKSVESLKLIRSPLLESISLHRSQSGRPMRKKTSFTQQVTSSVPLGSIFIFFALLFIVLLLL